MQTSETRHEMVLAARSLTTCTCDDCEIAIQLYGLATYHSTAPAVSAPTFATPKVVERPSVQPASGTGV